MSYLHMQVKEWPGFFKGRKALVPGSAAIRQHREKNPSMAWTK